MRANMKLWTALAAVVCLCTFGCGPAAGAPGRPARGIGKKLPAVALNGLTGESEAKQLADVQNKVVVMHFWGTWCPPCVKEFPRMEKLNADHAENARFLMLAISSGEEVDQPQAELRASTEQFLNKIKSELPQYSDKNDQTRTAVERLCGWAGYPCTVVLEDGVVRGVWLELANDTTDQVEALVTELLAK